MREVKLAKDLKHSFNLIKESFNVFKHYPKILIPLLVVWVVYGSVIIYLNYWFDLGDYSTSQSYLIIFGIVFIFAFLLSFSCSVLLEIIQQLESGRELSLIKAFVHTLRFNILKMLPIVFVFTILWFIILILQAFLLRDDDSNRDPMIEFQDAITAFERRRFILSFEYFEVLKKSLRMVVFLILPGIAWENLGFWQSIKKGVHIFYKHFSKFASGVLLTWFASLLIFLPSVIFFFNEDLTPEWLLVVGQIYLAFAWSYSIYLEQMFSAQLYLWNYKLERETIKAKKQGYKIPTLDQIQKPSILDGAKDLVLE